MKRLARPALLCLVSILSGCVHAQPPEQNGSCAAHVAQWLDPASGEKLDQMELFERLSRSRIVLLGETHTTAAHHRWQNYMLAALHSRQPNLMVGFEMLPRPAQPVLDAWSDGQLSEQELLEQTQWQKVWGYDPQLYLPLLHFARQNRLPTLALNIDRELVSRVGQEGWSAIAEAERLGLSDPAPASKKYRESLAQLYALKLNMRAGGEDHGEPKPADIDTVMASDEFGYFVDAQLTWDRAMAEALAAAHRRDPRATVIGIIGRGHLEYGYGIPHQLADMGIDEVDVLIPLDSNADCDPLPMDIASAVFVVDAEAQAVPPARPRLGVYIEDGDDGVRVLQVVEGSVAADSGVIEGDLIQAAAGFEVRKSAELIEIIQRQAPGTWLPLKLERDGDKVEIIARFPQRFD